MIRRLIVPVVLLGLAGGSYLQSQRTDEAARSEWIEDAGPVDKAVTTPVLSARRVPNWLLEPQFKNRLVSEVGVLTSLPDAPQQTCVVTYRGDAVVTSERADEFLAPASLMKIVTASAILELAGPDAVYTTEVRVRSDVVVTEGVMEGDIYLVGGGDPVLSRAAYSDRYSQPRAHTDIALLADQVVAELSDRGITEITGGVVGDESRYPEAERDYTTELPAENKAPIWKPAYLSQNQAGPLSALLLDDGYISYPQRLLRRENVRANDPALAAATVFDDLLEERGVIINGSPANGLAPFPAEGDSIGSLDSPPMRDIVARMLRHSDNTTAEMLLKEIGRRSGLASVRVSAVFGIYGVLNNLGIPLTGLIISDGSGLSTYNRLTCDLIADLLLRAGPDSPLVEGLSVLGEIGTLRNCQVPAWVADGTVRAKTGTLNDVTALAGVTESKNAEFLTFVMIANSAGIGADLGFCNSLQRHMITATAGHPYGPSVDAVAPLPARTNLAAARTTDPATSN